MNTLYLRSPATDPICEIDDLGGHVATPSHRAAHLSELLLPLLILLLLLLLLLATYQLEVKRIYE